MGTVFNRGTTEKPLWYCRYKEDGKWKERPTKQTSKAQAKVYVQEVEARIRRGLIGIPEPTEKENRAKRMTVREMCEQYLTKFSRRSIRDIEDFRRKRRSYVDRQILRFPLASMKAMEVRRADVERWQVALAKEYAPGTCDNALNMLSSIFAWAADDEIPGAANPCRGVERYEPEPSGDHYSMPEVHRLLRLLEMPDETWSDTERRLRTRHATRASMIAVALCLYTGLRRGELLGLLWSDMELEGEVPRVNVRRSFQKSTTKTGKSRVVPLHPEIVPYLVAWQKVCPPTDLGLVFPIHCRSYDRTRTGGATHNRPAEPEDMLGVHDLATRAKCMKKLSRPWHAMRHSLATHLMEASGNGYVVSMILGHSAQGMAPMTATYVNASVRYLHSEMCKMKLMPPPEPPPADVSDIELARRRREEQRAGGAA